jgi:hypothetical protein
VSSPHSVPSRQVWGSGDYRLAVDGGQIAFSWEAPGWLLMVEGLSEDDAEALVTEIAVQIGAATGGGRANLPTQVGIQPLAPVVALGRLPKRLVIEPPRMSAWGRPR